MKTADIHSSRAAAILEALPDLIASLDRDGRWEISHAPPVSAGAEGPTAQDVVTRAVAAIHPGIVRRVLETRAVASERLLIQHDDRTFEYEVRVAPSDADTVAMVVHDSTELHRLRSHAAFHERMAGLGLIAAGVAHEINNSLTFVVASLDALAPLVASSPLALGEGPKLVKDAREGAARITRIARDLRGFSRPTAADGPLDVKSVVASCARMLQSHVSLRARLVVRDDETLPPVTGSEARFAQIAFNLLLNAAQSIPEGAPEANEVRVSLRARRAVVVLEVADTGSGVSPELRKRIFDPFFTTKATGVGLGLFVTRGLVQELGGTITVEDNAPHGTKFVVSLPAARAVGAPKRHTTPRGLPRRRVLIVDDEPLILTSLARLLKPLKVVTVDSVASALELLAHDREFDLILCDMMMPYKSGMDLFETAHVRWPELTARFVFMSGGVYTNRAREFLDRIDNLSLEKPLTRDDLLSVISKIDAR